MSILNLPFASDPIAMLELAAIVLTLLFLFRLSFANLSNGEPAHRAASKAFSHSPFYSLFEVGNLLSFPKRSLKSQKRSERISCFVGF